MTTILAIDPGYRNCGIVVLKNEIPVFFTGYNNFNQGDVFERSIHISQMLQSIAIKYGVNCFASEKYFGGSPPPKKKGGKQQSSRPATNYHRGMFDGIIKVAMSSYPSYTVHPGHLKKWICGVGNARKEVVKVHAIRKAREESPEFYGTLLKKVPMSGQEHIIDAYFIGMITHHIYRSQYVSSDLPKERRLLLRRFESKEQIQPAHSDHFANLPVKSRSV